MFTSVNGARRSVWPANNAGQGPAMHQKVLRCPKTRPPIRVRRPAPYTVIIAENHPSRKVHAKCPDAREKRPPVRCAECGAELPGEERCKDRFHALLAAEQHHPEAAEMHGLFVLAYHVQHPSLCKPWLRAFQRETLREIFGKGRPWKEVLAWPKDRTRRQEGVDRAKERFSGGPQTPAFGRPVTGETTVADLPTPGSSGYPAEYPDKVESWARSVAECRFL